MKTGQFVVIAGLLLANVYATLHNKDSVVKELDDVRSELDYTNRILNHIRLLPKEVFISRRTDTENARHQKRILLKHN